MDYSICPKSEYADGLWPMDSRAARQRALAVGLTGWQECTSNFGHWCCFRFRFLFLRKFFSGVARKRKRLGASVYMHGVTQRGPTYELTMLQSRLLSSFFLVRRRWGMGETTMMRGATQRA